jgi:hypothetical protein
LFFINSTIFPLTNNTVSYVRFITTWLFPPKLLRISGQVVMNLAQQLDSDWQPVEPVSPEAPPLPTPQAFSGSLRLPSPFPLSLEEENEESPLERTLRLTWKLKNLSGQRLLLEPMVY